MTDILVGIDPSTQATGVVVLEVQGRPESSATDWVPAGDDVAVLRHKTIRPTPGEQDLGIRCLQLRTGLAAMGDWPELVGGAIFVIENPTDFPYLGRRDRGAGGAAGKVGAAFGVAYVALADIVASKLERGSRLEAVPSQRWLPKMPGRRGGYHRMKHKHAREWLRRRWPAFGPLTDDETFAAGVALFSLTRHPMVVAL